MPPSTPPWGRDVERQTLSISLKGRIKEFGWNERGTINVERLTINDER